MKETLKQDLPVASLEGAILNPEVADVLKDYAEIGLDDFIKLNEIDVSADVPIVKSGLAVIKLGKSIHDWFNFRKTIAFLNTLNAGTVDPKELQKRREAAYSSDKQKRKWFEKEVETICIYLDRCNDEKKCEIQAKLYVALINQNITFNEFTSYLQILESLLIADYDQLYLIYEGNSERNQPQCLRLQAAGLITGMTTSFYSGTLNMDQFKITDFGRKLCDAVGKI